jgi:RNA polymerase sigma-70 factor (ECF subfamily)
VGGRPPEDAALVRRAKEGDTGAFAALLEAHQHAARRLALLLCGSSGDADDAVEDAFVKSWTALDRFRDGAPFRPWLLRIVANESRNRRRAAGRRTDYELRLAEDRSMGGAAPSPEGAVLAAEMRRTVAAALESLPARMRDVVVCRHLLDLNEAETASVLGLRAGTVKSRLSRALARLRSELETSPGSPSNEEQAHG